MTRQSDGENMRETHAGAPDCKVRHYRFGAWDEPHPLAPFVRRTLEWVCEKLGHPGACWLLRQGAPIGGTLAQWAFDHDRTMGWKREIPPPTSGAPITTEVWHVEF